MSLKGAILRGKNLYSYRNVDGDLPSDITNDAHKMDEVTIYLDSIKPKVVKATKEVKNG